MKYDLRWTWDEFKVPHVVGEDPEIQSDGEHDGQRPETTNASVTARSQAARVRSRINPNSPVLLFVGLEGPQERRQGSRIDYWLLIGGVLCALQLFKRILNDERLELVGFNEVMIGHGQRAPATHKGAFASLLWILQSIINNRPAHLTWDEPPPSHRTAAPEPADTSPLGWTAETHTQVSLHPNNCVPEWAEPHLEARVGDMRVFEGEQLGAEGPLVVIDGLVHL